MNMNPHITVCGVLHRTMRSQFTCNRLASDGPWLTPVRNEMLVYEWAELQWDLSA